MVKPDPFEENQVIVILSIFVTTGKNRKKHLNKELKRILRIPRNVSFSGFFFLCLFVCLFVFSSNSALVPVIDVAS